MVYQEMGKGYFWDWLKNSGSYHNNFSLEGADRVEEYFEDLSIDLGENIEFDPIAWCCEWTEYDNIEEVKKYYDKIEDVEDLKQYTTVLELTNGKIIVQEF